MKLYFIFATFIASTLAYCCDDDSYDACENTVQDIIENDTHYQQGLKNEFQTQQPNTQFLKIPELTEADQNHLKTYLYKTVSNHPFNDHINIQSIVNNKKISNIFEYIAVYCSIQEKRVLQFFSNCCSCESNITQFCETLLDNYSNTLRKYYKDTVFYTNRQTRTEYNYNISSQYLIRKTSTYNLIKTEKESVIKDLFAENESIYQNFIKEIDNAKQLEELLYNKYTQYFTKEEFQKIKDLLDHIDNGQQPTPEKITIEHLIAAKKLNIFALNNVDISDIGFILDSKYLSPYQYSKKLMDATTILTPINSFYNYTQNKNLLNDTSLSENTINTIKIKINNYHKTIDSMFHTLEQLLRQNFNELSDQLLHTAKEAIKLGKITSYDTYNKINSFYCLVSALHPSCITIDSQNIVNHVLGCLSQIMKEYLQFAIQNNFYNNLYLLQNKSNVEQLAKKEKYDNTDTYYIHFYINAYNQASTESDKIVMQNLFNNNRNELTTFKTEIKNYIDIITANLK